MDHFAASFIREDIFAGVSSQRAARALLAGTVSRGHSRLQGELGNLICHIGKQGCLDGSDQPRFTPRSLHVAPVPSKSATL